ncbi:MAG: NAD-dependent DNA ligase LigA, partial [Desulfonatronovibrio sp.]
QTADSPTKRVGTKPVDHLEKVSHAAPMLSLNAALEREKVKNFYDFVSRRLNQEKVLFVLEPKFDGFSVELVYENGKLKSGSTRGDGQEGEDITRNLKTIRSIPLRLQKTDSLPDFLSVRGEVFMPKQGFQELNRKRVEEGKDPFANPRNAAAGTMRQLDPGNVKDKPLDIIFYEILSMKGDMPDSHKHVLEIFPRWGLKTDTHYRQTGLLQEIDAYHQELSNKRDELECEIDGIVIKLDSYQHREKLGVRQRSPRWAFAWKFPPRQEITTLEDIVIQVGRTGMLTPVALLQPVDVGGVTISRATLHNEDEVKKKDVQPGDRVRVARAGDVIPEIVERVGKHKKKKGGTFSMPDTCPACGSDVYREGAYYFCSGQLKCPAQIKGGIIHYASREALNINGLGEKTAEDLVNKDLVRDISDLYQLSRDDLLKLDGFAKKSADQLYQALQAGKQPELERFIFALGIRHVGRRVARILARKFSDLAKLKKAEKESLEQIPEIGPEIAQSVFNFFQQEHNLKVLDNLEKAGVKVQSGTPEQKSDKLEGRTFVFTGKLKDYTRQEASDLVDDLGGHATSSVSSETDYVVAGKNPGGKYDDAREQGVEIIDEEEFKKLISS